MTLFQKIIDREIPADIVFEDEHSLAFRDVNPQAPVHVLVIPKKPIARIADMEDGDKELVGHLFRVAGQVATQENLEDFRLVVNNGEGAGQSVFHLHIHVMGGRGMAWPPG